MTIMTIPKNFYFTQAQSNVAYTREPTGKLNIARMLKNKPYWALPSSMRDKKQKKLILSDWSRLFWTEEKKNLITAILNQCIDEGFYLYLISNAEPIELSEPINKEQLEEDLHSVTKGSNKPRYREDIISAAIEQKKLIRDEIVILDDHAIQQLLNQNGKPEEYTLSTYSFIRTPEAERENLLDFLKQAMPPITHIIHDDFSNQTNKIVPFLQNKFPHAIYLKQYARITFENDDFIPFLNEETITHEGISIEILEAHTFTDITVSDELSIDNFKLLLELSPHMTGLSLQELKPPFDDWQSLPLSKFSFLTELTLDKSNICINNLNDILAVTANLTSLSLSEFKNLSGRCLTLKTGSLPSLRDLWLKNSNPSIDNLMYLLKAAPNLKNLILDKCNNLAESNLMLEPGSLFFLEAISLNQSNPSPDNLACLLKAVPKLKFFSLDECNNLDESSLTLEPGSLSSLERIGLNQSNPSLDNLACLLKAAPKLKLLGLDNCKNLADSNLTLEPESLPCLETLCLNASNPSPDNLACLLKSAPKLKRLALDNCKNLAYSNLILEPGSLPCLETLCLNASNVSTENLECLLRATPNLKTLSVDNCKNLADSNLTLEPGNLPCLETLCLNASNPSLENLECLLRTTPNLKTLSVDNCKNLADSNLTLGPGILACLETLYLNASNVSTENLECLLRAAPNLKLLNLGECNNLIEGSLMLEPGSLPFLNNISVGHILMTNWECLLEAASLLKNKSTLTPTNPIHTPASHKDFRPNPDDHPFKFTGLNTTKNQGMIIEKISQYLTLTRTHLSIIPKIQDGICKALSHYFLSLEKNAWDYFIDASVQWDGHSLASLPDKLKTHFSTLYEYIYTHQLGNSHEKKYYLGDNLRAFLKSTDKTTFVFYNPWHAISVRKKTNVIWEVYDPNFVTGCLEKTSSELEKAISLSIGALVFTSTTEAIDFSPKIDNAANFIEAGGILALCQCENENKDGLQQKLSTQQFYSRQSLDGLLLRDMQGKPAWVLGHQDNHSRTATFTHALLQQFIHKNPHDYKKKLEQSIEVLTPAQKHECITQLIQQSPAEKTETSQSMHQLIETTRTSANESQYEKDLQVWNKNQYASNNILEYCQHTLKPDHIINQLIELDSTDDLNTLRRHLQNHSNAIQRPVFYIDKPEDLICSAPFIKKNIDGTGELCRGPGGPLYDFLKKNDNNQPVMIINYETFYADDVIRFNELLDKNPRADGTKLPEGTQIVGLLNRNKPDYYQGSDFYSRFDNVATCSLPKSTLKQSATQMAFEDLPNHAARTVINLFHMPDWEEILMGQWVLDNNQLKFKEGELAKAIQTGLPIEIQNGLWEEKAFQAFMIDHMPQQARLSMPSEGYAWETLNTFISKIEIGLSSNPQAMTLNPTQMNEYLERYIYNEENHTLSKRSGFIEEASNTKQTTLLINLTRSLNEDIWARLLTACQACSMQLDLYCAPGVALPSTLFMPTQMTSTPKIWNTSSTILFESTDPDMTIANLTRDIAYDIIDISECSASDLLLKLDGKLNEETLQFNFNQSEGAVLTSLKAGNNILLTGKFSTELIDQLAPYLLKRQATPEAPGMLVLITTHSERFSYIHNVKNHTVSHEEKHVNLEKLFPDTSNAVTPFFTESFSKLKSRCSFLERNAGLSSDHAWLGINEAPELNLISDPIDMTKSASRAEAFIKARVYAVNHALQYPFVFLTGLSGVGKSTFVKNELCGMNDTLYVGENQILAWATDTTPARKVLFLDEANLNPRQWSEFEGLFYSPQTILIHGVLHRLTPEHKVIFAGNPLSYGDERKLAPFFERHGNALLFEPLIADVIYEKILKPVFNQSTLNTAVSEAINTHILKAYQFVCACSKTDVLISPRELQMIALLTRAETEKHPETNITHIAEHFTYHLIKNIIPNAKKAVFDNTFLPRVLLPFSDKEADKAFLITPSRQLITQHIEHLLDLREWRKALNHTLNDEQKYGGLGGIIIEGQPGIGKSELVISELINKGYTEARHLTTQTTQENFFYRIPVSMVLDEKKSLLLKAFEEGAVVIIDEINSSPMMEQLLNELLMGKNLDNKRPTKPGFMLIGTQNPVNMAGRRAASTALQRRLIKTILPEYTTQEMEYILTHKGVPNLEASAMVKAYEKNHRFSLENHLSDKPNFRNLLNIAEKRLKQIKECKEGILEDTTLLKELLPKKNHFFSDKTTHSSKFYKATEAHASFKNEPHEPSDTNPSMHHTS